jgi:hypothetical protein
MLITKPQGRPFPPPDMHAATVQRNGYHKDYGGIAYENDGKVLTIPPPTAEEHDVRLGLAPIVSDRQTALQCAADYLGEIAAWFAESNSIHSAGLRAYALALLLKPDMLPEQSATGLARELGVTKQAISKYVSHLVWLGKCNFHAAGIHGKAFREKRSKLSIAYHVRVGHAVGKEAREEKARIQKRTRLAEK